MQTIVNQNSILCESK